MNKYWNLNLEEHLVLMVQGKHTETQTETHTERYTEKHANE